MRITILGTGYVGLVTGTCFAEMGNRVICVDHDPTKIDSLKSGRLPLFEPGLDELVRRNAATGDLSFETSPAEAVARSEIVFIAVGTPMGKNGSADLRYVAAAAEEIGAAMKHDLTVVDKSTVPVGTAQRVRTIIEETLRKRMAGGDVSAEGLAVDVVSNPEFLKEGSAVADFMKPDRVILGVDSERARQTMEALYAPFMRRKNRVILMSVRSAEMTKYAANAMLAARIGFMNEIARLCDRVGADIGSVREGIGTDKRIGTAFLFPGCGYGGSCFPKDVRALAVTMREHGVTPRILEAVDEGNEEQKRIIFEKIAARFGADLSGRTFAVWGLAFKPNTDDMREAPAVVCVRQILDAKGTVRVFDPEAMKNAKEVYFKGLSGIVYSPDKYDALTEVDALVLMTEWNLFRSVDLAEAAARMKSRIIFDGRNIFIRDELVRHGFEYYGIGVPPVNAHPQAGSCPE